MKRQIQRLLLLGFFLIAGLGSFPTAHSQPTTDPCDTANPDLPCPIDGGLSLLLVAGACYGIVKHRSRKQHENEEREANASH